MPVFDLKCFCIKKKIYFEIFKICCSFFVGEEGGGIKEAGVRVGDSILSRTPLRDTQSHE